MQKPKVPGSRSVSTDHTSMRPQSRGIARANNRRNYKIIDLFAGIGGIRLAFENAGYSSVFSSEWDKSAAFTYATNFKDTPAGDIRAVDSKTLPDFDVLCGGFPCQPFSIAGVSKKNALGRPHGFADETQGTLFFEVLRILKDKKPAALLLENVKNLTSHDKGRTMQVILAALKEAGYHVHHSLLNARKILPQNRERIFIAGFRNLQSFEAFQFPELKDRSPRLSDILEKNVPAKYTLSDHLWQYLQDYKAKHEAQGHGFGFGLASRDGISRTLSARYYKDGSEILIPSRGKNPRRLTPRECARLMGFPDHFKIVVSDTQAYKQFGNSVAVPVVQAIAENMKKALDAAAKTQRTSANGRIRISV